MPAVQYTKDRDGSRHSDKWNVVFSGEGDTWDSGNINRELRKLYIHNGEGETRLRLGNNSNAPTYHVAPGEARDWGDYDRVIVTCERMGPSGGASIYIHAEWNA